MRRNPYYSTYYICLSRLIVLGIIPFSLLTFFNVAIYNRAKTPLPLIEETSTSTKVRGIQENDLSKVLIAIVALFIVCHTLRFFLNFYEMIWIDSLLACLQAEKAEFPVWSHIVQEVSRLLLILNSSSNNVIYCCFNTKFRNQLTKYKRRISQRLSRKNQTTEYRSTITQQENLFCDQVELENFQDPSNKV